MNESRVEITGDLKEAGVKGQVQERAGEAYAQETRIDTQVSIRVATPRDGERLRGMFARASSKTIYRRFHLPYPEVPEWMLTLMLGVDHHKESLVAVAEEKVVGHAMYVSLEDASEAEMAIIVEDGWQSKGVGKSLLSELAQRARLRGIDSFVGEVLGTNQHMLGLAAMFTGTDYTIEDGVCHVRMPLRTPDSTANAAQTLRRAA
jgi:GNAT superfamily N-acetyltransferase